MWFQMGYPPVCTRREHLLSTEWGYLLSLAHTGGAICTLVKQTQWIWSEVSTPLSEVHGHGVQTQHRMEVEGLGTHDQTMLQ